MNLHNLFQQREADLRSMEAMTQTFLRWITRWWNPCSQRMDHYQLWWKFKHINVLFTCVVVTQDYYTTLWYLRRRSVKICESCPLPSPGHRGRVCVSCNATNLENLVWYKWMLMSHVQILPLLVYMVRFTNSRERSITTFKHCLWPTEMYRCSRFSWSYRRHNTVLKNDNNVLVVFIMGFYL